jgi:hypothetical protein
MTHYCVRYSQRPIWGVIGRVYEYTRSVIVAAYGFAMAAHGLYHDRPDNPEEARAVCRLAADTLDAWLHNRLPAGRDQYETLAHARDTFRQLSDNVDHRQLAELEASLQEYLGEDADEDDDDDDGFDEHH